MAVVYRNGVLVGTSEWRNPAPAKQAVRLQPPLIADAIEDDWTLTHRADLAELCDRRGLTTCVEVGVDCACFACQLLSRSPYITLYAVDPWLPCLDFPGDRSEAKRLATAALAPFDDRVYVMEMSSLEAAKVIPDPVDFVYIDGTHDSVSVSTDIRVWYDRLRPGGLLAGHDFDTLLNQDVQVAVLEFARERRLVVNVIRQEGKDGEEDGSHVQPSWYVWKPA